MLNAVASHSEFGRTVLRCSTRVTYIALFSFILSINIMFRASTLIRMEAWCCWLLSLKKFEFYASDPPPHLAARRRYDVEPDEGVEPCRRSL